MDDDPYTVTTYLLKSNQKHIVGIMTVVTMCFAVFFKVFLNVILKVQNNKKLFGGTYELKPVLFATSQTEFPICLTFCKSSKCRRQ